MDVWNVEVFCQLLGEEGFTRAWLSEDANFERFEATLFAEFILDKLDVLSQAILAVPVEVVFAWLLTIFGCSFLDKQRARDSFDV